MRRFFAEAFRHPRSGHTLLLRVDETRGDDVVTGTLTGEGDTFPIVRGVPRFCAPENYAGSFGYQWQHFATTQLDSRSTSSSESETRLFEETRWPSDLGGQRILEAGSGMGRFTEILARTGAEVHTFDYSAAVDANRRNLGDRPSVSFAQADIYAPPYERTSFDKVLCIGVLQHCPNPEAAFKSLVRFLKPGGEIVIDVYRLSWKSVLLGKYYLRPVTRRLSAATLHRFVRFHVGWVYPLTGVVHRLHAPSVGRKLSQVLGMADHRGLYGFDEASAREHSELDTFDMLSPTFDKPKTIGQVRRWLEECGLEGIDVAPGYNGVEARGRRPRD